MSAFTKTCIVDGGATPDPPLYNNIATAVSALSATGGTVIVEEYNSSTTGYIINAAISVPSNITIIGRGNVLITVQSNVPAFQNSDTITNGNERIVVSGFKIVANCENYSANIINFVGTRYSIIENCTLKNATYSTTGSGIYLAGISSSVLAEGNLITGCTIQGLFSDPTVYPINFGIKMGEYSKENMVSNNTVDYCKESCYIVNSPNNIISGNIFRNSENAGGTYGGIYISTSDYNVITGNQCLDNIKGICISSSYGSAVQGNICQSNTNTGIQIIGNEITSALYNSLLGNICTGNSSYGILLNLYTQYTVIDGNNMSTNSMYDIAEAAVHTDHNLIVGNICNSTLKIIKYGTNTVVADNIGQVS